jgi:hypothetical protein
MTLAAAAPGSTQPSVPQTVPIVVLGTDALLAALPATPVQLAHACLRAGYASVIPASWGDELIAAAVLDRLARFGERPAIQCSCPFVAHRLLSVGGDLRHALVPLVAPPVAVARYLRVMSAPVHTRITYVGACPGAFDESIDIRMTPAALLDMLAERAIVIGEQPGIFESVLPPDRRRFRSQPGGLPATEMLWTSLGARAVAEIDGDDLVAELAQHLLADRNVLIDLAPRLGCVCSGASTSGASTDGASTSGASINVRAAVTAIEPPRAAAAVIDERVSLQLDLPLPASVRTPIDVIAVPASRWISAAGAATNGHADRSADAGDGGRVSPLRGVMTPADARDRTSAPAVPRPTPAAVTVSRESSGKALTRAYIVRRRMSPRSLPIPASDVATAGPGPAAVPDLVKAADPDAPRAMWWRSVPQSRQLVYVAIVALLVVLLISTVIGVIVGRALAGAPTIAAPAHRIPRL